MEETQVTNNQSLKIQLSLASLMFFSPFTKYLLKDNNFELDQKDLNFVEGYISLGWINLILFGVAFVSGLTSYFYNIPLLNTVYQIIVGILVVSLAIGCIGAITEINIIKNTSSSKKDKFSDYTNTDKAQTLLSYIPGYSIYLWYNKHDFSNPDLLIKESMTMWILFGISCFIPNSFVATFIGIIILTRIVSLIGNINIIPKNISEFISSLFYKNPEEIWAYIWGSFIFVFHGKYNKSYWKLLVDNTKKEYQYLYDVKKFGNIQGQYFLAFAAIVAILRQIDLGNIPGLAILAILLVFIRYGVMIFFWSHSPSIPLMREIVAFVGVITKPFTSKK